MILLLGGTSDTAPLATLLAEAGFSVLVSTATDNALDIGNHPCVERRSGHLDAKGIAELVKERGIRAIVDATHPYATEISAMATALAHQLGLPYISYLRPAGLPKIDTDYLHFAESHQEAAQLAASFDRPILLTTGSRNLIPYSNEASKAGLPLFARVLDCEASIRACREAGLAPDAIITGRGPFTLTQNLCLIRQYRIGVLVTKDGGSASGIQEKSDACLEAHCQLVVVERPRASYDDSLTSYEAVVNRLCRLPVH